jgi:hypothetical protein
MDKPKEGDVLLLKSTDHDEFPTLLATVHCVFDNLAESWDPYGEHAWSQADVDEYSGQTGEWYAVVYNPKDEGETWSVASYEVESIE